LRTVSAVSSPGTPPAKAREPLRLAARLRPP
jgi:hypothetical protein